MLIMSLHVPNKMSARDKETWILTIIENAKKRYALPTLVHIDMNTKFSTLNLLNQYLNVKGWNHFQDNQYSWRKG